MNLHDYTIKCQSISNQYPINIQSILSINISNQNFNQYPINVFNQNFNQYPIDISHEKWQKYWLWNQPAKSKSEKTKINIDCNHYAMLRELLVFVDCLRELQHHVDCLRELLDNVDFLWDLLGPFVVEIAKFLL